jgi:hypothetical protein
LIPRWCIALSIASKSAIDPISGMMARSSLMSYPLSSLGDLIDHDFLPPGAAQGWGFGAFGGGGRRGRGNGRTPREQEHPEELEASSRAAPFLRHDQPRAYSS